MHSSTGGAQRGVGAAGGAVESSSQSLNLANTEINQNFHTKRCSKIKVALSNKLR